MIEAADKGSGEIGCLGVESHQMTGHGIGGHRIGAGHQQPRPYGVERAAPGAFAALGGINAVDQ